MHDPIVEMHDAYEDDRGMTLHDAMINALTHTSIEELMPLEFDDLSFLDIDGPLTDEETIEQE